MSGRTAQGDDDQDDPKRAVRRANDEHRRAVVELGARIRRLRGQTGLTQHALAARVGLAADVLSRLENGRFASPGLRTLMRVADALEVSWPELVGGDSPLAGSSRGRAGERTPQRAPERTQDKGHDRGQDKGGRGGGRPVGAGSRAPSGPRGTEAAEAGIANHELRGVQARSLRLARLQALAERATPAELALLLDLASVCIGRTGG